VSESPCAGHDAGQKEALAQPRVLPSFIAIEASAALSQGGVSHGSAERRPAAVINTTKPPLETYRYCCENTGQGSGPALSPHDGARPRAADLLAKSR
jgi:hypothetical protein